MIIGISGKKGTGKDTIGTMIQYFTDYQEGDLTFDEYESMYSGLFAHRFEIKKYADILKDMICMLIGCSREQLEDQEFKNTPIGEQWDRTLYHISSRDNKALETFDDRHEAEVFAAHWDEYYDQVTFIEEEKVIMTPRLMLQLLGTECGRMIIHNNIWVNALMSGYKPLPGEVLAKYGDFKLETGDIYPDWIITDVRFPNEKEAIEAKGGIVIRVNKKTESQDFHASEIALDLAHFKYEIDNNGSIEELLKKVKEILNSENLINKFNYKNK
jgi:ABC-type oligopeptide transport system ATPase subunit